MTEDCGTAGHGNHPMMYLMEKRDLLLGRYHCQDFQLIPLVKRTPLVDIIGVTLFEAYHGMMIVQAMLIHQKGKLRCSVRVTLRKTEGVNR